MTPHCHSGTALCQGAGTQAGPSQPTCRLFNRFQQAGGQAGGQNRHAVCQQRPHLATQRRRGRRQAPLLLGYSRGGDAADLSQGCAKGVGPGQSMGRRVGGLGR